MRRKTRKGDRKGGVFLSVDRWRLWAALFSAWDSTIGRVKKVRQHDWDGGKGAFTPWKEGFHSTLRVVAWRTWRKSPDSLEDNMIQTAAHWFSECYPTLSVSRLHLVPHSLHLRRSSSYNINFFAAGILSCSVPHPFSSTIFPRKELFSTKHGCHFEKDSPRT